MENYRKSRNLTFLFRMYATMLCVILASTTVIQAVVVSTFDTGDDGWKAIEGGVEVGVTYSSTDGYPGGYIHKSDLTGESFGFRAPTKFLGNQSGAFDTMFSWDFMTTHMDATGRNVGVWIHNDNCWIFNVVAGETITLNVWNSLSFDLNEDAGWGYVVDGIGQGTATNSDIQSILSNITRIGLTGETIVGIVETSSIDNVRLVPEPTTMCLLGLGGLLLRRRKSA